MGQRYHVIVEANPNEVSHDGNYWLRTVPADGCGRFADRGALETKTGILRYNESSTSDPTTTQNTFGNECADETYTDLRPTLKWEVPESTNSRYSVLPLKLYQDVV